MYCPRPRWPKSGPVAPGRDRALGPAEGGVTSSTAKCLSPDHPLTIKVVTIANGVGRLSGCSARDWMAPPRATTRRHGHGKATRQHCGSALPGPTPGSSPATAQNYNVTCLEWSKHVWSQLRYSGAENAACGPTRPGAGAATRLRAAALLWHMRREVWQAYRGKP